ncbi:DNA/RNA-binding protein KIN17 [Lingula anatina]|uniref:DNA/RNA-binding protein KIN17 n=1 Tax=Lingula anatina TaxID=7574 RepID=A0A1S3H5D1_LINAN|nr:DNA/RNA-binding protein KIN17 [Lingula anatina]XP_023933672.1 DNA/RNA-binding protein KIN17 [Lingula anatina]|eukprot:XP_013381345.1 DNA/RNA-binding protein KIN17 [Lingula anatina]
MSKKGGFLTPKAIANRIKAKGLQKLRWYCQMCQKQCRDENGFKCHTMSESHQRQLLLFAERPDQFLDTFSKEFEDGYLEVLKRRFGTKRVHCNIVYQEYIADREHVHMNSTQWETLTEFVKHLGKDGSCVVDETEKGWFVQYIDRDPETIRRQEALKSKEKMELDDEEKVARFIQKQIERAAETEKEQPKSEYTELKRESEEEKVAFNLAAMKKSEGKSAVKSLPSMNALKAEEKKHAPTTSKDSLKSTSTAGQKRKNALDEIMEFEEQKKEKMNRKDYWLHKGIVVKVVTKKLGDKFYKKKGVVKEVVDQYAGVIKMLDSGDKVKVDQAHVETVIPAIGKSVLVVNGAYRGSEATLLSINEKKFSCSIKIVAGPLKGREVDGVQYEDVSKLHLAS